MTVSLRWQGAGAKFCVCVGILLISTGLRLHQITVPVIWLDEAFSVILSRLTPEQILFHTARDVHPPLYYLILHYWMHWFGSDPLAVRSFSVCAGVATVGMGMLLVRQLASWRAAVVAGLLLAFFPIGIRYSQEARMYALLGLMLITALYMLWQWVYRQKAVYLAAYCLLMIGALYTHYFSLLCMLANWVYLFFSKDEEGKVLLLSPAWWVAHVLMAVAYLPWLPILYQQLGHRDLVGWIVNFPISAMSIPLSFWNAFTLADEGRYASVFSVVMAVFIMLALLRVLHSASKVGQPGVLVLSYCFVPVFVVWLVSYIMPLYINRYLLFSFLGLPLITAMAVDTLQWRARVSWVVCCLLVELGGLAHFYNYQATPGGNLGAAMAHVNEQWREGDALLADRKRSYLSIEYYNATGQPAFLYTQTPPDTTGQAATTYGTLTLFYRQSEERYVAKPQLLAKRFKRLWLVTDPSSAHTPFVPVEGWTKTDEMVQGSLKVLLFVAPEQASR